MCLGEATVSSDRHPLLLLGQSNKGQSQERQRITVQNFQ